MLVDLFSLGVTAEALRANISIKIGDFAPTGVDSPKISGRRGRHHQPFFSSRNDDNLNNDNLS